jgi:hypothetical protein
MKRSDIELHQGDIRFEERREKFIWAKPAEIYFVQRTIDDTTRQKFHPPQ